MNSCTATETVVLVNGLPVVRGIKQDRLTRGRVGLITRQTTAKFDRLLATREYGDPEFRESFSAGVPAWDAIKGSWSVVNDVYQNSAIQHGSITLLPIFVGDDSSRQTQSFAVYSRMLNPFGGSGNRMGFVYDYQNPGTGNVSYKEIVFGADGIARANDVQTSVQPDGSTSLTVIPRETAPYPGARNQWFDVRFAGDALGDGIDVSVNGTPVFTCFQAGVPLRGRIGLVANWTPGRFDDVWFCHGCGPFSLTQTFEGTDNPPQWFALRGSWDSEGGVLNNRTAGVNDLVYMSRPRSADYTVSAHAQPVQRFGQSHRSDLQLRLRRRRLLRGGVRPHRPGLSQQVRSRTTDASGHGNARRAGPQCLVQRGVGATRTQCHPEGQ